MTQPAPMVTGAFWVDDEYDREQASDGISRFGAYVRRAARTWSWDDPQSQRAWFAVMAWETATPPVMSPGYVRRHPRVRRSRVEFNPWDATLTGVVELVTSWPQALARSRGWQRDGWWLDWPVESCGEAVFYREPGEDETAAHRYLMASARLVFPLPVRRLPAAPAGPRGAEEAACDAVRVLVAAMDAVVAPVIEALEGS
jgi:hypothetical protein